MKLIIDDKEFPIVDFTQQIEINEYTIEKQVVVDYNNLLSKEDKKEIKMLLDKTDGVFEIKNIKNFAYQLLMKHSIVFDDKSQILFFNVKFLYTI